MSDSFFKFNKEISSYFMNFNSEDNIELEDKEYNRHATYLNIFDVDKNGSLNSNEVKSIWSKLSQECKQDGDELSIDEKSAEKILKEYDTGNKLNGKGFIVLIKYLLTRMTNHTRSWEPKKTLFFQCRKRNFKMSQNRRCPI